MAAASCAIRRTASWRFRTWARGAGRYLTLALPDAPITQRSAPDGPAVDLDITVSRRTCRRTLDYRSRTYSTASLRSAFRRREPTMTARHRCVSATTSMARRPFDAERVTARYRIGTRRNREIVGWGTLVHLVDPGVVIPGVTRVWQPLAATGGEEPETIEHVRQIAPEAFRAIQFRAVTERDWEEMALRHPDVAAAKASFRWTGSWHTVFVAIHPVDAANLRRLPGGGTELQPTLRRGNQGASHALQACGLRSQHTAPRSMCRLKSISGSVRRRRPFPR